MSDERKVEGRGLFALLRSPDASVEALVRAYATYVDNIGVRLKGMVGERIRAALGPAGAALTNRDVLGQHHELKAEFLHTFVPQLRDLYFAEDDSQVQARTILTASDNAGVSDMLPPLIGKRMRQAQHPAFRLLRHDAADLFVAPKTHQAFSARNGTFIPLLSARAVSRLLTRAEPVPVDDPVVIIRDRFAGGNFAHLLFDMVPRILHLAAADPDVARRARFVMGGSQTPMHHMIVGLLQDTLGLSADRFLFPEAPQVIGARNGLFGFSDQFKPAHPMLFGHPPTVRMLRGLLARVPIAGSEAKRIYISRSDAHGRRLANEDAAMAMLARHGFTRVVLRDLPLAQQIAVVSGAGLIVAPHGMGLTHILFHRGRPRIIELFNPNRGTDAYAITARALGFEYDFVLGTQSDAATQDFTVELAALEDKLTGGSAAG